MNTTELLWFVWPWIGFGGSIVLIILLLFTDKLRSDGKRSKFYDVSWLAWAIAAAYLLHVLEEYGLHVSDGQYELITSFKEMGVDAKFGGLPMYFFPYVNIALTWVAMPIAAAISKKHPVIGLSGMGFEFFNGLTHVGASLAFGMKLSENAGVVTGVFLFLPLFFWTVHACRKENLLPEKGLGIAIAGGIIGHLALFSAYAVNLLLGHTAAAIYVPVVAFMPLIASWILCKAFRVKEG